MKMYWNTQPYGFIKGEMFWYIIKDGGGEDIGKENIFFFGGGGVTGIWKMMDLYFLIFRVAQNLILMTFWDTWTLQVLRNIHAPDDITRVKI